jgi:hypothetical protein
VAIAGILGTFRRDASAARSLLSLRAHKGAPMLILVYLVLGLVSFAGLYGLTLVLDRI